MNAVSLNAVYPAEIFYWCGYSNGDKGWSYLEAKVHTGVERPIFDIVKVALEELNVCTQVKHTAFILVYYAM